MIGIVLAGGVARRMGGGDKGLLTVGGRPILERVFDALRLQCDQLVVSANGEADRWSRYGYPVVADSEPGGLGPLAGLLAGMEHVAAHHPKATTVLTVPADAPFLPKDLVARLDDRRLADQAAIVQARSGDRTHPTVALWSLALRHALRRALLDDGQRKVGAFAGSHPLASVTWPTVPHDPFFNVNTPADLAAAERVAEVADRPRLRRNATAILDRKTLLC